MKTRVRRSVAAGAVLSTALLASSAAMAHYPWLLASDFTPTEGSPSTAYLAWGHHFPVDGFMSADRLDRIAMLRPDGRSVDLEQTDTGYATPPLKAGVNTVVATQKGGFFTRTRSGPKRQSKEGLKDVIRCSFSSNNMKMLLNVGDGRKGLSARADHPLEIFPLTNPAALRVGDRMDVRVTMRGEPYSGMVHATYAGFSTEGAYAYSVEADNEGKASIRILHPGQWLVYTNVQQAYPDPEVCDIESYTTTLTFAIR